MKRQMANNIEDDVIQIDNPEQRKKVPIKLSQKIADSGPEQPIVGLDSVVEFIPVSNDGK